MVKEGVKITENFKFQKEKSQNGPCRIFARDYFKCRMDKGLMDSEEWGRLGYADIEDKNNLNNSEQINIKNQNKE